MFFNLKEIRKVGSYYVHIIHLRELYMRLSKAKIIFRDFRYHRVHRRPQMGHTAVFNHHKDTL